MLRSFFNQLGSIVVALLMAIIVWSVATNVENPTRDGLYPEALTVELVDLPQGLVVHPKTTNTVRIRIRAPQASWDQLGQGSFRAFVDLKSLSAGLHQVPVQIQVADPNVVIVSKDPSTIGVQLEELKTREFDIQAEFLDAVPAGFTAKPPTVDPVQATVSGPGSLVDQVAEVVADTFIRGAKAPFDRAVTLVARDAQGNVVEGVTIQPSDATVSVQIEQRVGYKDVSIKVVLKGAPAPGYWVSNILANPSTVTVVGSAGVLAQMPGFVETVPLDVSGATADVSKPTALSLPGSVTVLNNVTVTVQVSVTPILGGQTVPRQVVVQGMRSDSNVSVSPTSVDVILSGPLPSLQNLQPDDVQVAVDVSGLSAGTYQLKPHVLVLPAALKLQSIVPDSVQVTIVDLTPTPTATITSTVPITETTVTPTPSR